MAVRGRYAAALVAMSPLALVYAVSDGVTLNNGVRMPVVSLGTAEFNGTQLEDAIFTAVSTGIRGVDTAFNYYNQVSVGKGLKKVNRSEVFLITKTTPCYHPQAPPHYNISDVDACASQTREDVLADFSQLGVDTIDLLLLHGANHFGAGSCGSASCALNVAQWKVYEDFLKQGKVRAIGVSNYCQSCLQCLMDGTQVVPAVNQIKYHPGMTHDPEGLISYGLKHGIIPMAYSPLSGAFDDPFLKAIAKTYNKTSAQVALKWIASNGFTLATASKNPSHLAEDVDLFSWSLSPHDREQLDAYSKGHDAPSWACTASLDDALLV